MKRIVKIGERNKKAQENKLEILVEFFYSETVENNYEEGEIGNLYRGIEEKNLGLFPSFSDLYEYMERTYGLSGDSSDWEVLDDGLLGVGRLKDDKGVEVEKGDVDYERWKRGEINLWSTSYYVKVKFARTYVPDEEELRNYVGE